MPPMIEAFGIASRMARSRSARRSASRLSRRIAAGESSSTRVKATPPNHEPYPAQMQHQHRSSLAVNRRKVSTSGARSGSGIESSSGSSPHGGGSRNSSSRSAFSCTSGCIVLPRCRASSAQVTGS